MWVISVISEVNNVDKYVTYYHIILLFDCNSEGKQTLMTSNLITFGN